MSRYSRALMKIIAESGLTAKEVVERCNELGNNIDTSRLSKLQNGRLPAPSEKVSRDIARVCNVDERILVLEGYLEKAPKEVPEAFLSIKVMMYMFATGIFENKLEDDLYKKLQEKLNEEPLADFIISLIDGQADTMQMLENEINISEQNENFNINMKLEEPLALKVSDNGMFPKIIKNSKVTLKIQNNYEDWDILAVKLKDKGEMIVRFALINKDEITLKPLNNEFEIQKYNLKDITILGKVTKIITDI